MRTGRVVAPWGDPVGKVRVLGVPLEERQDRTLHALGLRVAATVDASERASRVGTLLWDDDVDVTVAGLRAWLRAAGADGGEMIFLERPVRRGDLEAEPAGPVVGGEPTRRVGVRLGVADRAVCLPPRGFGGVAKAPGPWKTETPWWITARSATTIHHWAHALRANLAALPAALDAELIRRPWNVLSTWARAPLRAGFGRFARVGRRCRIHPTARLEMCVLGDDVEVGAYSVLRACVVSDGAKVEDHVTARGAILGPGAHLGNFGMFNLSVLGARSSISHIGGQACIVGDDSFVATFATLHDLNLRGNVRVPVDGRLVDTGSPFLGCAVGHRVRMGAGVVVASGRAIPNDVTLVADAASILARVDAMQPGTYAVRDGRAVGV